MLECYYWE